jgi:hypothetical protein
MTLEELILNKPLSEVKRIVSMHQMTYEIWEKDGISRMLTCDYVRNRVRLTVENNIVTSFTIG